MRITIVADGDLIAKAQELTGINKKASLFREALKTLIARESAKQLARFGGIEPNISTPPRRRLKSVR
jgi:hypothetical protein